MDLQFHGANCITINTKHIRLVIDDNLAELGVSSIVKSGDVALFTHQHSSPKNAPKLIIDGPGEYEIAGVSILGIRVRSHMDEDKDKTNNTYKILVDDLRVLITGHMFPDLSDSQLEVIGAVDVLCIPVGGNGYTLDGESALKLIKKIEPKLVIPTHFEDKDLNYPVAQKSLSEALTALGMDPKDTLDKLKVKSTDLSDLTQLIVLKKV